MVETLTSRRKKVFRDAFLIALSILVAVLIHQINPLEKSIENLSGLSFIAVSMISGVFFASTFTVLIAVSIFLSLSAIHNPFLVALLGGLGALVGDSLIFKFLRDDLIADFEYLSRDFPKVTARRILHSKLTLWLAPIIAAFAIASPIPDEIGLLMLASIKTKYHHFFLISFLLNTFGILLISLFGRAI